MRPRRQLVLAVDPISCDGRGICAELLPEWIRLDDWGYPVIGTGAVPPELVARARWAASNCPALALSLRAAPKAAGPAGGKTSISRSRRSSPGGVA